MPGECTSRQVVDGLMTNSFFGTKGDMIPQESRAVIDGENILITFD